MKNWELSKQDLDLWFQVTKTTDKILKTKVNKVTLKNRPINKKITDSPKTTFLLKRKISSDIQPKDLRDTDKKLGLEKSTIKNFINKKP